MKEYRIVIYQFPLKYFPKYYDHWKTNVFYIQGPITLVEDCMRPKLDREVLAKSWQSL